VKVSQVRARSRQLSDHDHGFSLTHEHVTAPMACKKATDSLRMPATSRVGFTSDTSTTHVNITVWAQSDDTWASTTSAPGVSLFAPLQACGYRIGPMGRTHAIDSLSEIKAQTGRGEA